MFFVINIIKGNEWEFCQIPMKKIEKSCLIGLKRDLNSSVNCYCILAKHVLEVNVTNRKKRLKILELLNIKR